MSAYYNEFKPEAAAMLRQLIRDGLIADGEVDDRSITEVQPDDIKGFTQCHFFAGIGGWSVALRLALWGDDRPVWTGSCPCQPFSSAGKQKGHGDERHLWPHWARLIRECRPPAIFGEQVASAITFGWWDDVAADLEAEGYACAAAVLPACSVGKPHKRNRLWFVGNSDSQRLYASPLTRIHSGQEGAGSWDGKSQRPSGAMGNAQHDGRNGGQERRSDAAAIQHHPQGKDGACQPSGAGQPQHVADTLLPRLEGFSGHDSTTEGRQGQTRPTAEGDTLRWIACPDGKSRPAVGDLRGLVNGLHNGASAFNAISVSQSEKEVRIYAASKKQRPEEIMREVRNCYAQEAIWKKPRGFFGISEEEILRPYLCELDRRFDKSGLSSAIKEIAGAEMRSVRLHALPSCSPQGWGLHQQQAREYPNSLHALSRVLAQHARQAFEAMRGDAEAIRLLEHGIQHRAPLLHAFGNAIVPSLAAAFIQATKGEVW